MANQDIKMRVQYSAEFDTSKVSEGLKDIRKQLSSSHIGEDLRKQLETALNKVEVNIPALQKMGAKGEYNSKELETFQKLVQQVSKDMQALDKLAEEADFTKSFSVADTEKIKQFEKQLDEVENKIKSAKQEILKNFSSSEQGKINGKSNATLNGFIEQLISVPPDQIEEKLDEIIKEAEQQADNAIEQLQQNFQTKATHKTGKEGFINLLFGEDSGVSLKKGKTLNDPTKDGVVIGKGAYSIFNEIREQVLNLEKDAGPDKINEILEAYSNFINEFFNVPEGKQSILANAVTPEILERLKSFKGPEGIEGLKALLGEGALEILKEGEAEKLKLTQEQADFLNERLQELVRTKQLTTEQAQAVMSALGGMNNKIKEGAEESQRLKNEQDALSATFGSLIHRIESAVSAMAVFNKGMQITRNAIRSVEELDAAFTQIAIVSEQTGEQAWKLFDDFNKLAKQYSITTKDLTEGAKLFYQQGLNATDTMKMVEASTVSAALGEVSMAEAANTLTAAIQGYNESAAVAMDYTDKIAKVGAVSAADFNELSAAMEKTASSAYTAGIDFDHLLGFLGRMIEVTREAPANLGTAMKTIIARFQDMKENPAKVLEDGVSFNKVEEALKTLGISMRDTAGEFRPLQEVFVELGLQWDSLTRNQQAYIATVAAGSRQQSRFLAMMNDFERTLELITESQNSAGEAAREYAIYQDSIQAAQARLAASWEKFYSKIVDNDIIKFAINALSEILDLLSHIPPSITAIGSTIGALGIQSFLTSKGGLISIVTKLLGGTDNKEQIKAFGLQSFMSFLDGFNEGLDKSGIDDTLRESLGPAITKGTEEALKGMKGLAEGAEKTGNAFTILKGRISSAFNILKALFMDPIFLAIAAAIAVITAIGYAIYKAGQKANDAAKKVKNLNEQIDDLNSKSKNNKELINSYDELIQKTKRTEEEQKQLNNIIDQIAESYDNANVYIDEYGNRHLTNVEILKEENIQLDENIKKIKLQAIEAKKAFLKTPSSQWTQENVQQAGLPSDFYQRFETAKNTTPDSAAWQVLESNLYEGISDRLSTNADINDILTFIDDQIASSGLNFELDPSTISNLNKTEDIINAIKMAYMGAASAAGEYEDQVGLIIQQALQMLDIEAWGIKFNVDPIQAGLKSAFMDVLRSLSPEQFYNELGKNLIESFELSIKQINSPDEVAKAQNFLNDAIKGIFNADSIVDVASNTGVKLGNDFLTGLSTVLKNREKELKENTKEAISNIFGGIDVSNSSLFSGKEGMTQQQSERMVSHAQFIKNNSRAYTDYGNLYNLSNLEDDFSELDTFLDAYIKDGTVKGLTDGVNEWEKNVAQNGNNPYFTELAIKYADQQLNGAIDQIILNLETSLTTAKETFSQYKNYLNMDQGQSLSSEEYSEIEGILGKITSDYIDINSEGEKFLTIGGKIAIIEKANQETLKDIDRLLDANNEKIKQINNSEKLSKNQKEEQIKYIQRQNELLQRQKNYHEDINNVAKQATVDTNISIAEKYFKDLKTIEQAEKEMIALNGRINTDTRDALNQMGAEYVDFIGMQEDAQGYFYTLNAENLQKMRELRKQNYAEEVEQEKQSIQRKIDSLDTEIAYFSDILEGEKNLSEEVESGRYREHVDTLNGILTGEEAQSEKTGNIQESEFNNTLKGQAEFGNEYLKQHYEMIDQAGSKWNDLYDAMTDVSRYDSSTHETPKPLSASTITIDPVISIDPIVETKDPEGDGSDETMEWVRKYLEAAKKAKARLEARLKQLQVMAPNLKIPDGAGKSAEEYAKQLEAMTKAAEQLADALEDLDKLLKDINTNLKDISVDYNPFLDLFEAWEKEWDYYYNIKRLIAEIGTQGQFIDNIISADYISADERVQAYHAKIGNLLAQMAANDAYIEALRAGMSQTAVELMKDYGDYYKVDPTTGQIYQTDKNLTDINKTINQTGEEIYNLQKLQNEKENDLTLENAKLEALEQEKSAYEEILNTIESQLDSLNDKENITIDLSELESKRDTIKANIELSEESIETTKDRIEKMEDEIQEIEVQITLKEQTKSDLEKYVDDMENKVSEYEEYWENLNSTIAEQQELLQSLNEIYATYVDTAVSTQQELYDAIVENYQKEIDEKKKEYDELKKLDNDYLNSIKDNIDKEREARDESKKQKSYQQSIQRAQLLQMDTSGAYRTELANLKNTIEDQRQELYDDLVDKQVKALEKEIEERHKLYDREVEALEQRLAYYQENAILLWEMVNTIVAEGSSNMMAILEGTIEYINSNELSKQQQRETWENNVKMTFDGVKNGTIDMLNSLIQAGNNYITQELPEINKSLDEYNQVFINASETMKNYNDQVAESLQILKDDTDLSSKTFKSILDSFMTTWNSRTNEFTGYAKNWKTITDSLKTQAENNIIKLKEFFDSEGEARKDNIGSIKKYNEKLEKTYTKVYEDFITERNNYRDELETLVERIRTDIEAAIKDAAKAIRDAANSISANTGGSDPGNNGGGGSPTDPGNGPGGGTGPGEKITYNGYNFKYSNNDGTQVKEGTIYLPGRTREELWDSFMRTLENIRKKKGWEQAQGWGFTTFKTGGLANFTGPAWLDGTKSAPERILSPHQTKLFESMVSSLERASNNSNINSTLGSSYNIGDINTSIQVAKLDNQTDINKLAKQVEDKIVNTIRNRVVVSM